MDDAASDAELWQALLRDPDAGLGALYDRHAGLVHGLALAILRDAPEAEDLTQEIFLTLARGALYDPARGSLAAFLSMLTRSRAIDRLRAGARRARTLERALAAAGPPEREHRDSPLERMSTMELSREVAAALAALPERQRRVLELAYFRGLTQTEIAAELDAPLGTVKSSARNGLLRLRGALEHLLG